MLHFMPYFFVLIEHHTLLYATFDAVSSTISKVLSVNSYPNLTLFGDLNIHHKDFNLFWWSRYT